MAGVQGAKAAASHGFGGSRQPCAGYRRGLAMAEHSRRIVAIGAGVIGITSAYYLAGAGHRVTVIDRNSGPALETGFANAGMPRCS